MEHVYFHVIRILPFLPPATYFKDVNFGPFLFRIAVEPECAGRFGFHGATLDLKIPVFHQGLTLDCCCRESVVSLRDVSQVFYTCRQVEFAITDRNVVLREETGFTTLPTRVVII